MRNLQAGRACTRCRQKHFKCDEARPSCGRCVDAGVQCSGFNALRGFIHEEGRFRRRVRRPVASRQLHKSRETTENVPPSDVESRSFETQDESRNSSEPVDPDRCSNPDGRDAEEYPIVEQVRPGPVGIIHDEQENRPLSRGATPGSTFEYGLQDFSSLVSEFLIGSDREMAFLIRHFCEVVGPWMDLYDTARYFTRYLPIKSVNSPLLRYAAAAIAAKHLGRVKGNKYSIFQGVTEPAMTEVYPGAMEVDWYYKAANYYHRSLAILRRDLLVLRQDEDREALDAAESGLQEGGNNLDELLAAASILSVLEFMDGSNVEWTKHLNGISVLLTDQEVARSGERGIFDALGSQAARAAFWNFARQDYLAAFINKSRSRLDPSHNSIWRAAGLPLDDTEILSLSMVTTERGLSSAMSDEDVMSNALVWLLIRLVNLLALIGENNSLSAPHGELASADSLDSTLKWEQIHKALDLWFQALPSTFRPCARLERHSEKSDSSCLFSEIFYSFPSCAATMQHYYFARLLILLHSPLTAATHKSGKAPVAGERLQQYRDFSREVDFCCQEICGIALGRPEGAVRIHMVQPLFVAGQCMEHREQRRIVISLLQGIELDTGWETGYRVRQLLAEWGTE
ncbi:hypothetical protein F5884DRAFT_900006 [Xylogone sp. PMI_703]|nr:hypothetical protein F5884DRAFT_900006 [Xylogone sp. PMI_703]